jgi:DNA-binding CsgD family transcriptional regulator
VLEENSAVRKMVGAIVGIAILLGLLLAVAFYTWSTSAGVSKAESRALAELKQRLSTVDDLERRGILPEEIAEAQRQYYSAKAQTALSESHLQALVGIKYRTATIDDLQERGILSAAVAKAEKQRYLVEAQTIVGETLDSTQLATLIKYLDTSHLAEAQQTSSNGIGFSVPVIVWVFVGALLVAAAGWFIRPYLRPIRERIAARRSLDHMPASTDRAIETIQPDHPKGFAWSRLSLSRRQAKQSLSSQALSTEQPTSQSPPAEPLTRRELEVLELVAEGLTNREIAQRLTITPGTAKVHISNIYSKLGVNRRVQAITRGQELGILPSAQ